MSTMRLFAVIAIFIASISSSGCGGGDGDPPPPVTQSRIRLTINWAERTRNVTAPTSALSATVKLPGARVGGGDLTLTADRNGNAAAHAETYQSVEQGFTGNRRVEVTFFASAGGAGAVVATASATVRVGTDGKVLDTITNVQRKITSVQVASGQSLTVGEDKFLGFTARDAENNVVAISSGSARFAVASGAGLLSLTGIVARGLQAGETEVTATVDGITSPPTPVTVLAPVAIAYVANGQNASVIAFLQVLQGRNVTPTRFDSIPDPATLQSFDVLVLGDSGNLGTADAAKVKAFLDAGRGVVLLGRAPALLANGNFTGDMTPIAPWFGNIQRMVRRERDLFARTAPGLFPLPASVVPGEQLYRPISDDHMVAVDKEDIHSPLVDRVAGLNDTGVVSVYALAYELPDRGSGPAGRVYWQWDGMGRNSAYTEKVLSLFLAGTYWTARR